MKTYILSVLIFFVVSGVASGDDIDKNNAVHDICCCSVFYEKMAKRDDIRSDKELFEKLINGYVLIESAIDMLGLNADDVNAKKYICFENMKSDIQKAGGNLSVVIAKYGPMCGEITRMAQARMLKGAQIQ